MFEVAGSRKLDVIIVGAGVAGLATLAALDRAGLKVACVEARDRIGGRILTLHDPRLPIPIELGAEFIHGKPPETWEIIAAGGFAAYDCTENAAHIESGRIIDESDAWLPVGEIMSEMETAAERGPDCSFSSFLSEADYPEGAKKLATSYVEGFNAAHADQIGIASLAQDSRAAAAISGDNSFRLANGYDAIPNWLLAQVQQPDGALVLNSVVEAVRWRQHSVSVEVRSSLTGERCTLESRRVVITVPLGVLQAKPDEAGAIRFDPAPGAHLEAAKRLCFGQVFRTILRFKERVWERNAELADAGFLLSDEPVFPTWWTPLPFRTPSITGWSAGRRADPLLGESSEIVIRSAVERLGRVLSVKVDDLRAALAGAYFHDWSRDPFARGAYSYVPAGGLPARELLAQPLNETLYFSGEATETNGHGATVHGAIASGRRVARQILQRDI